jgi:hypothetical protein
MINNQQQTSIPNDSTLTNNIPNSTTVQPMINHLQQSVSDVSTLSSTTNSDGWTYLICIIHFVFVLYSPVLFSSLRNEKKKTIRDCCACFLALCFCYSWFLFLSCLFCLLDWGWWSIHLSISFIYIIQLCVFDFFFLKRFSFCFVSLLLLYFVQENN